MTRPTRDDRGFTLVELLVYVVLLAGILTLGAGLVMSVTQGSLRVTSSADASRDGQTIARTITTSVRNASHVSADGDFVVARLEDGAGDACHAWYAYGGSVYARISDAAIAQPAGAPGSTWMRVGTGLVSTSGVFTAASGGVKVTFQVDTRTSPTLIETVAVPRLLGTGGNPCA
ncbi:prepilin-type N-terminal cleavage/methylation domain-containing protein [Microbacterium sp. MEC084]|uniref:prepilin-type N-terminal cleavage/methylation domain-containing protein n=1 Tax=Microbacterium sp. MEC084 TaxID=1963027 RepID=UPI0011040780|nr:prepilin-type N-terminal cleavage/methylation domain-containing protein [Microbacterium sp. MEC084]MCD1267535.1 prepilin-type N-terminal cleavage/methylation domain-containing protein [Microbacterium sp. MEC084]